MENSANRSRGLWRPDLGDGTYKNPVLFADYSDPDVVRIGGDYFLVSSSFNCMPAIPVLHSKDLVNWKIVNYVFGELPLPPYRVPQHGKGVWAPSLKVHGDRLWVFFCTPDEGIMMSSTADPFGKWDPLTQVKQASGWIDCCPFWDDDGKAYLLNAFAKSRAGFNNLLQLCEMAPDGTSVRNPRIVFNANGKHEVMEGPKLFKRGGWYYITAPAGGITHGYQVVMRSQNICGPYEDRIVLHEHGEINGPRQGNFVDTPAGDEWFLHFRDMGPYGRVVCLEPVMWKNGWPIAGVDVDGDGIGEPVAVFAKPRAGADAAPCIPQTSDNFENGAPGLQWQWYANPRAEWRRPGARPGCLRLLAAERPSSGRMYDAPNLLLQKFPAPAFRATAKLLPPSGFGGMAGLIVTGSSYAYLCLEAENGGLALCQYAGGENEVGERKLAGVALPAHTEAVWLRVGVEADAACSFAYSCNGEDYLPLGSAFKAEKELWIGAKMGVFCTGGGRDDYCDFDSFTVE